MEQGPSFGLPSSRTSEQQDAVAMAKYLLGDATPTQKPTSQNVDPEKRMKTLKKVTTTFDCVDFCFQDYVYCLFRYLKTTSVFTNPLELIDKSLAQYYMTTFYPFCKDILRSFSLDDIIIPLQFAHFFFDTTNMVTMW